MVTWTKVKEDDDLLFEKEILPVGDWEKWISERDSIPFTIKEDFLENLVANFQKFKEVGVRVPLFKGHSEDPDTERGLVENVLIKPNEKGKKSSYVWVRFHSSKFRDQGINNDVSVGIPEVFHDGAGNSYSCPLRHVALTSYPVLPALSGFKPLYLAFEPTRKGSSSMYDEILEALQLSEAETALVGNADDDGKKAFIIAKIAELLDTDEEDEVAEIPGGGSGETLPVPALNLSFPPMLVNQMIAARNTQIDALVPDFCDPATADDLRKSYCSRDTIRLDLSNDKQEQTEFDRMIAILRSRKPIPRTGRTPLTLSSDKKESSVVRNMKKRKEAKTKK